MAFNATRRRDRKRTQYLRVWFNGVEVTSRCFYVDTRRKRVRLYLLDSAGHKYLVKGIGNTEEIATVELRGRIRVRYGNRV